MAEVRSEIWCGSSVTSLADTVILEIDASLIEVNRTTRLAPTPSSE